MTQDEGRPHAGGTDGAPRLPVRDVAALLPGAGAPPVVLLHGFDGEGALWSGVQAGLAKAGQRSLAYDLPAHGGAEDFPQAGPPKVAARAVLADLRQAGIERAHLVGHSMGGAVAALAALFSPGEIASLTLLAPGGFGPEIGTGPIRAVMEAETETELALALGSMGAPGWRPDEATVRAILHGRRPGSRRRMRALFALLFAGERQGVLPLEAIAGAGIPTTLVWGDRDGVTPFAQMGAAPAAFRRIVLPGIGHMPMLEDCAGTIQAILSGIGMRQTS